MAPGVTARAAILSVRERGPARVVLAVPVAPRETLDALRGEVDELACLLVPENFFAVGQWYDDFRQTTDEEVLQLLQAAGRRG